MVIIEGKKPLNEMAQFKGLGINIVVQSDDHGKLGNKASPAHAHVYNNQGKEVAQIILSTNTPKKASDIEWYRTPNPPSGLGDTIVKLVNQPSKAAAKAGMHGSIWQNMLNQWIIFHET